MSKNKTILTLAGLLAATGMTHAQTMDTEARSRLLDTYCAECHNFDDYAGGIAFELLDVNSLHEEPDVWEKVIRKVRSRQMPPAGQARPDDALVDAFALTLEDTLDAQYLSVPNPGAPLLHRMNRTEYGNAIRDLLDLRVDASEMLPADDSSAGFDNIANVLGVSPALMQAYVSAAAKISRLAVGDMTTSSSSTTYRPGAGVSQASHLEGMPFGTRGGVSFVHNFPLDAEYEFTIGRTGINNFILPPVGMEEPIEVVINGERVKVIEAGEPTRVVLPIPAGPHEVQVAFIHQQRARGVDDLNSVYASSTNVSAVAVNGPLSASGPGDTPSRSRIFSCMPANADEEQACASEILSQLGSRAFRRPIDESSLQILLDFYAQGRELRGFETGIQYALARILVDPQFIYRFESEPADLADGEVYRINDYELASRLSFFLWSSIPDDELLEVAGAGSLSNPQELERQVKRMLADPKADALVNNFAAQWLSLRKLEAIRPVVSDFDGNLRQAMQKETLLLFDSILREDRSIIDLLDADYTFVNERLARHYDIPNVRGSHFRRVSLADNPRKGVLGHGSILTLTSAPNRTSPVIRGQWIMETFLGTPAPPPPPGVEANLEETVPEGGGVPLSVRQRLEEHRANPACEGCHGMMDPIGFALENFDLTGKWRDNEFGLPVDTEAQLWDGTPLDGLQSLKDALLERRYLFVLATAEKLMTYALGRRVEHFDMPWVRRAVRQAETEDYRFSALIQAVVETPAFQMRRKEAAEAPVIGMQSP